MASVTVDVRVRNRRPWVLWLVTILARTCEWLPLRVQRQMIVWLWSMVRFDLRIGDGPWRPMALTQDDMDRLATAIDQKVAYIQRYLEYTSGKKVDDGR